MALDTWYLMDDGSLGDPFDVAPGDDGLLAHKDGRKVAYAPHGPRSRGGVNADAERAKAAEKPKNGDGKKDEPEPKPEEPALVNAKPSEPAAGVPGENREVVPEAPKPAGKTRKN